jgi:nucleoid DNA-binding protein
MDAQTLSQLAAMGYVSGDGMAGVDLATLPDPKDFQEFLAKANRLEVLTKRKGAEEGLKELNELIAMRPESFELRMRKVNMLGQAKRMDELSAYMAQIAKDTDLSRKQVAAVFESLNGIIKKSLRGAGLFTMPGLLKLKVVKKPATKAREGVNPFTGEKMVFKAKPASKKVRAMPLKSLKGFVN